MSDWRILPLVEVYPQQVHWALKWAPWVALRASRWRAVTSWIILSRSPISQTKAPWYKYSCACSQPGTHTAAWAGGRPLFFPCTRTIYSPRTRMMFRIYRMGLDTINQLPKVGKGLEEDYRWSLASAANLCRFALQLPPEGRGLKPVTLVTPVSSPSLSPDCQECAEIHLRDHAQPGLVTLKLAKDKLRKFTWLLVTLHFAQPFLSKQASSMEMLY